MRTTYRQQSQQQSSEPSTVNNTTNNNQRLNNLETKVSNVVKSVNETIININELLNTKTFISNVKIYNNYEFNEILFNELDSSLSFCKTITQYDNLEKQILIIGDPLQNSVYFVEKKEDEMKIVKTLTGENNYGNYISCNNTGDIYVISNDENIYFYYNEKLEHTLSIHKNEELQIIVVNKIIYVLNKEKIEIYYRKVENEEGKWEKLQEFGKNIEYFCLNDKHLVILNKGSHNLIVYENGINKWNEKMKIVNETNNKDLGKQLFFYNELLVFNDKRNIKFYNIDGKNYELYDMIQFTNEEYPDKICIKNNLLLILTNKKYLYLYEKSDKWLIKTKVNLDEIEENNEFDEIKNYNILIFNNDVLINKNNNLYVLEKNDIDMIWKGEFMNMINKAEIVLSGNLNAHNDNPKLSISLEEINLPKIKEKFYYLDIPLIRLDVYDVITNSYINNYNLQNIVYDKENRKLTFTIDGIKDVPYNYVLYLTISYITE